MGQQATLTRRIADSHVVIVGGTGMLMEASKALAHRCGILTSVAGTKRSLLAMDRAISGTGCEHRLLALDWSEPDAFVRCVVDYVRRAEVSPSLVLAWLHNDRLGPRLATALVPENARCAFFQVRGSAAANPAGNADALLQECDVPATIDYHQIILGFQIEGGGSRWLRDSEISAGVLTAIDRADALTIVGTVTPWSRRP